MSDSVTFSEEIFFPAQGATMETIFSHIRKEFPGHPEFVALLARETEFDAIGGWFFDELSRDALLLLQQTTDRMVADLPAAAAHWNPDRRPLFYSDIERFRSKLAERISQFG